LKGVLFGPPKSGKTSAAASRPKTLVLLTEPEGDLPLRGRKGIDVVRPENWGEMASVIRDLATTHKGKWETLVFDSVSMAFEVIGGKDIFKTLSDGRDVRQAYQRAGSAMNQLIFDAVRLPMNVVFVCQLKHEEEQDDGTALDPELGEHNLTMAVTPMVYKTLTPAVSFIGRTYQKKVYEDGKPKSEYWVSFNDFGRSPAGSRIPLPEQVQDLTMDKLLAAMKPNEGS